MEAACKARAAQLAADMHAMALAKVCGPAPRVGGWMDGVTFYGAPEMAHENPNSTTAVEARRPKHHDHLGYSPSGVQER